MSTVPISYLPAKLWIGFQCLRPISSLPVWFVSSKANRLVGWIDSCVTMQNRELESRLDELGHHAAWLWTDETLEHTTVIAHAGVIDAEIFHHRVHFVPIRCDKSIALEKFRVCAFQISLNWYVFPGLFSLHRVWADRSYSKGPHIWRQQCSRSSTRLLYAAAPT